MSIETLVHRYHQFQNDYGHHTQQDYNSVIVDLFSPEFKKTANGQVLADKASSLENQLHTVREFAGSWSISSRRDHTFFLWAKMHHDLYTDE